MAVAAGLTVGFGCDLGGAVPPVHVAGDTVNSLHTNMVTVFNGFDQPIPQDTERPRLV